MSGTEFKGEGSLQAPTRHAVSWKEDQFLDEQDLYQELERVFDICHGCRRCVSLCQSFPTLFDLVDESSTFEVDGVKKEDYMKVVDECYLCDLCYLTKCPYVPPHEWNIDFPHLMLRAKAFKFKKKKVKRRDKILSATDALAKLASIPIVVNVVNASTKNKTMRKILQKTLGIHPQARLPMYHRRDFRSQFKKNSDIEASNTELKEAGAGIKTTGRVVIFTTCYGNYNEPGIVRDLLAVLEHNKIEVSLMDLESCCGMPKMELGDLAGVEVLKNKNVPEMMRWLKAGWDFIMPIPSCALMFKQELPLLFADEPELKQIAQRIFDPFEYLDDRLKAKKMLTDFTFSLGKIVYQVACHQRVQRIGPKTKTILSLVPEVEIKMIERCSGHDGTYALKNEFFENAAKIARPVVKQIKQAKADYYTSDCAMAGRHLENLIDDGSQSHHPITLLRMAYGLPE